MVSILIDPASDVPSAMPTCLFVSFTITTMASTLIIYRIFITSKDNGVNTGKYQRTVEIVAESGMLYAIPLLIVSVLMAFCSSEERCNVYGPVRAAYNNWGNILMPMTVGQHASIKLNSADQQNLLNRGLRQH